MITPSYSPVRNLVYGTFVQQTTILEKAFRDFKGFVDFQNPWLNNQGLVDCTHPLSESILRRDKEGAFQNIDVIDGILTPFFIGTLS